MRAVFFALLSLVLVACPKPNKFIEPEPMQDVVIMTQPTSTPASTPTAEAKPTVTPVPEEKPPAITPTATANPTPKTEAKALTSYVACGCGCCGGLPEPTQKTCVYHAKGDSLEAIKANDEKSRQSPKCAVVGCSRGTKYEFCD
jgi:hypothetical protein